MIGLEFHDSEVTSIDTDRDSIIVTLERAVIHETDGVLGYSPGISWTQTVKIRLFSATLDNAVSVPFSVDGGTLECDGSKLSMIELPYRTEGAVILSLQSDRGEDLVVKAFRGLNVDRVGPISEVEKFPGTSHR